MSGSATFKAICMDELSTVSKLPVTLAKRKSTISTSICCLRDDFTHAEYPGKRTVNATYRRSIVLSCATIGRVMRLVDLS